MKQIICITLIFLLIFSAFTVTASAEIITGDSSVTLLRAGGGGGSGGGGSGGSGGSSSSHHHHYPYGNNSYSIFSDILLHIVIPLVFFSSTIIFYFRLSKRSRNSKKLIKKISESDNAWKYNDIETTVSDCFYAVQNAWTNMDMSLAKEYISDELNDKWQIKLNWMEYKNERNILEKISLVKALPVAIYDDADNSRDYIWFFIKGRMVDYTIDTTTMQKKSGSTIPASFIEYWQFIRQEDKWLLNEILQKNESDKIPFND